MLVGEQLFDTWESSPYGRTLYRCNRAAMIDTGEAFPDLGVARMSGVPLWVRHFGFRPTVPAHPGRLLAWLRCFDNTWLGLVELTASSSNGHSTMPMQLWLPASAITPAKADGKEADR